jgi:hypothetical protein
MKIEVLEFGGGGCFCRLMVRQSIRFAIRIEIGSTRYPKKPVWNSLPCYCKTTMNALELVLEVGRAFYRDVFYFFPVSVDMNKQLEVGIYYYKESTGWC